MVTHIGKPNPAAVNKTLEHVETWIFTKAQIVAPQVCDHDTKFRVMVEYAPRQDDLVGVSFKSGIWCDTCKRLVEYVEPAVVVEIETAEVTA